MKNSRLSLTLGMLCILLTQAPRTAHGLPGSLRTQVMGGLTAASLTGSLGAEIYRQFAKHKLKSLHEEAARQAQLKKISTSARVRNWLAGLGAALGVGTAASYWYDAPANPLYEGMTSEQVRLIDDLERRIESQLTPEELEFKKNKFDSMKTMSPEEKQNLMRTFTPQEAITMTVIMRVSGVEDMRTAPEEQVKLQQAKLIMGQNALKKIPQENQELASLVIEMSKTGLSQMENTVKDLTPEQKAVLNRRHQAQVEEADKDLKRFLKQVRNSIKNASQEELEQMRQQFASMQVLQ